jgi:cellulose synthase/poly-beta-1,6-N-acetylglucosamine synthase-like glycosyltransferase
MGPVVSIVLPAFNAGETLARALLSVRAQTLADWELLVVDDGSTDDTAEVVERTAARDSRVVLVRRPHGGIVAALNEGSAAARGRFIARMDADDEMLPGRLAGQVALLEARPDIGVASCLVEFAGDPMTAQGYALHVEWMNALREPEEIARNRFIESPVAHPSVMFRRKLLARHGGYADDTGPEDYELWLRWMDAGVRFAKVPEVLLRWHDPPARLSRTDARYAVEAFYAVKCRHLARVVPADRPVWLWGAGRITRQRFAGLAPAGVKLAGFIDVDPKKLGRRLPAGPVIAPDGIPRNAFVIVGVGTRGARELIRTALQAHGRREDVDFVLAA